MPHNQPIEGGGQLILNAGRQLSDSYLSPDIMNVLINVNTILNALIGLVITLAIVLFGAHLVRWAVLGNGSERGRASAAGALRAFFVLFAMVDIWFFMRLLQHVENFSAASAYAVVLLSFLVIGAWSFLGIGQIILDSIAGLSNYVAERGIALIRGTSSTLGLMVFLKARSDTTLRLFILVGIMAVFICWALYWSS